MIHILYILYYIHISSTQYKRCSSNFLGIKPHPNQRQYYYVCKPDCVIFGKCQNLQVSSKDIYLQYHRFIFVYPFFFFCSFSMAPRVNVVPTPYPTSRQFARNPVVFPFYQTVPHTTDVMHNWNHESTRVHEIRSFRHAKASVSVVHSAIRRRYLRMGRIYHKIVSINSHHVCRMALSARPLIVRSTTRVSCNRKGSTYKHASSLWLRSTLANIKNINFLFLTFRCPDLTFYDTAQKVCRPQYEVACDSIQLSELVYPRPPALPHLPVIYPPHYALDSLEDSEYPAEYSLPCSKEGILILS